MKLNRKNIFLILLLLTIFGGMLRFYGITKNPVSLSIDEVSFGYNAYSILKTGRDEYGKFLPLTFKSTGDYKNPVPIYSMVPSVALFGLNEFGIRFPTALIATLSIPIFYLLFIEISGLVTISLVGTLLLSISPWHIYYSRYVSDHLIAATLVMIGVLCFLKIFKSNKILWPILSAISLILSMYTYYAERLFVPLFVLSLFVIKKKDLKKNFKKILVLIITCFIICIPLIISVFFGPDISRAKMTWVGNDVEFVRNVNIESLNKIPILGSEKLLLIYFIARKYLYYFDPGFLFYSGLNATKIGSYGLGILYLFELPLLILGILYVFRKNVAYKSLIFAWILIGLIPASLTNNEQHPGRTFVMIPALTLLLAIGGVNFFEIIKNKFNKNTAVIFYSIFLVLICINIIQALLIYSVHFPNQRGEDFMDGTKESVQYALMNKTNYKQIVFDPYRGIEAPYIVSIPHMYILFYSQYDPLTYQTEQKNKSDGSFGFDKFIIRKIDWREDRNKKDTLFIGSPWSLPEKDIKPEDILKKIYLSNGSLAFFIVSPK